MLFFNNFLQIVIECMKTRVYFNDSSIVLVIVIEGIDEEIIQKILYQIKLVIANKITSY